MKGKLQVYSDSDIGSDYSIFITGENSWQGSPNQVISIFLNNYV
jgi:hypothetical protein